MQFYRAEPTARTSWRLAILMGANSRTYKFPLGATLLQYAASGHDAVPLGEFAAAYTSQLLERPSGRWQSPTGVALGARDFLTVLDRERQESTAAGRPTEALVDAAVKSIPSMVMQKFHNLRAGQIPHTFYELSGRGSNRIVRLTPDLLSLASVAPSLFAELDSRWAIVEASFDAGIGKNLVASGVDVDIDSAIIVSPARRVSLTSVRGAIIGFQHGRCFYCREALKDAGVHVDHVFPFAWMKTGSWRGPNLNHVWNLVLACAPCNLGKGARLPSADEIERLLDRNDAIAESPRPLHRTLEISMRATGPSARERRRTFIREVYSLVTDGG
ncbi:HNH endonuclease [Nocardia sp. NPDC052278]|uniref:HNH endonuclease n=1 Tax=unclassified Nocardia TaxID=2637762 RepID=UPI00369F4B57